MSSGSFSSQTGRMIVVASGKGGVGKTWFSISLAQALARKVGLTRFGGHPETFTRGAPDAEIPTTVFA